MGRGTYGAYSASCARGVGGVRSIESLCGSCSAFEHNLSHFQEELDYPLILMNRLKF